MSNSENNEGKRDINDYLRKSFLRDSTPRSLGNLIRSKDYIEGTKERKHILCSLIYDDHQESAAEIQDDSERTR